MVTMYTSQLISSVAGVHRMYTGFRAKSLLRIPFWNFQHTREARS